jgi:uncharacterized membrane protein YeaQ/YmgE (transglycosylase-associated protein family)
MIANIIGAIFTGIMFASVTWWFLRQFILFVLHVSAAMKLETAFTRRLAELGHHLYLDVLALLIGLICGIIAPFLSAQVSVIFMKTGLALLGATFLFYLINRHVFKDEHAGERGF